MRARTYFLFTLSLLIFCISIGYSLDKTTTEADDASIDVRIQFYDRQTYYIGDQIIVEFQIVNENAEPYLFITSFNKIFTFDFDISTFTNRGVEHSIDYAIERTRFEPVLNDEITLKPHEVYGVRVDIAKWFNLTEPGEYVIRGLFYPALITDPGRKIASNNELYLSLNPSYDEAMREKRRVDEIKRLKAESLPPYEVVNVMLKALMNRDFEKYFIYVNFEKFIMQFDNARKKYTSAHDAEKPAVIEEFKQYLRGENKLEGIPFSETIPADYEIMKSIIEKRDSQVSVIETFKYLNLYEKKQYTYHLHLYGDKWLLDKYQVVNIGF